VIGPQPKKDVTSAFFLKLLSFLGQSLLVPFTGVLLHF